MKFQKYQSPYGQGIGQSEYRVGQTNSKVQQTPYVNVGNNVISSNINNLNSLGTNINPIGTNINKTNINNLNTKPNQSPYQYTSNNFSNKFDRSILDSVLKQKESKRLSNMVGDLNVRLREESEVNSKLKYDINQLTNNQISFL